MLKSHLLKLTDEEKTAIEAVAESLGQNQNTVIRACIVRAISKVNRKECESIALRGTRGQGRRPVEKSGKIPKKSNKTG